MEGSGRHASKYEVFLVFVNCANVFYISDYL